MRYATFLTLAAIATITTSSGAQGEGGSAGINTATRTPAALLTRATHLRLGGEVDSNSPAIWELEEGRQVLHVLTSAGKPSVSTGANLQSLAAPRASALVPWPAGANWIEALVTDVRGTWYGYYHNERNAADLCPGTALGTPRIGAARSYDHGLTWEDLGIILEAPRGTQSCSTTNEYFVGGVGDFSVQLDPDSKDLYIFFSAFLRQAPLQGVGVARFNWAHRDRPAGKASVWNRGVWLPVRALRQPSTEGSEPRMLRWFYPPAMPFYPAAQSWHDEDTVVDAFWGPSVHWNTYLQQYVMLLNRAKDSAFSQEGIYVAFAPRLDDPLLWSTPVRILLGGTWYPQVMGTEPGVGTDKIAGQTARFFMKGQSSNLITFSK